MRDAVPGRKPIAELPIYINGRFLTQSLSGVQRFAAEVTRAIDELLHHDPSAARVTILAPRSAADLPGLRHVALERTGRGQGHLWEQGALARAAARGVLVSLAGTGPVAHRRHVVTIHDASVFANPANFSWRFRAWYRTLYWLLRGRAHRFVTVSEFSRAELVRCCKLPRERIDVVYSGMDHIERIRPDAEVLRAHGLERSRYVLCVGNRSHNKNVELVVAAMRRLDHLGLRLVAAGSSNARVFQPLRGATGDRITMLGHVSDGALRALYENALCLAFPSRYEGFGIPPLEAMASGGCPVVVARTSALPEACGDAALYCDPDDAAGLADCIRRIHEDESLRARLRAAGLARAARFRWKRCGDAMFHLLLRAAGGAPSPS